ncbi:MAG: BON domain-containing protein [Opitutaceae bacterium]|jgi:osmotically-inducible protein OsmY|nr:BON domain-containing protein [Opitutaceae bacterium]
MKTSLLTFLLGVAIGAIGFYYSSQLRASQSTDAQPPPAAPDNTPAPGKPAAPSGTTAASGGAAASGSSASTTASGTARPTVMDHARDTAAAAGATASAARNAVAQKLVEWKLTASEIKDELAKTSRVVREKAQSAGAAISTGVSNTRIVAVIKAKYTLDRDLDTAGIGVDCDAGKVTLTGALADPALVGRAITLALDTEGVREVVSLLAVPAPAAREPDKGDAGKK